ncbi:MAG: hypothetical protein PHU53_07500 [Thermoplasmata archaeon]|nr:hypothetical protein [Thermoplasmata archaeon]
MSDEPERRLFTRPNKRRAVWAIIIAIFLISLAFSVLAAQNYTEVAKAKSLTFVVAEADPVLTFANNGSLESVNMTLDFTAVNPSGKELRLWVLTYKGWVRDLPLEEGIDNSRWMVDGNLYSDGTEKRYYPIFAAPFSFDNPSILIPPNSNVTVTKSIILNTTNYPDILANFWEIWNYTDAIGLELEWMHYTSTILFIQDVPQFSGADQIANTIKIYDGIDITPGVGGAHP